jgi:hypothetical protein
MASIPPAEDICNPQAAATPIYRHSGSGMGA